MIALLLVDVLVCELLTGKFSGRAGRYLERKKQPCLHYGIRAIEMIVVTGFVFLVLRDSHLKSRS